MAPVTVIAVWRTRTAGHCDAALKVGPDQAGKASSEGVQGSPTRPHGGKNVLLFPFQSFCSVGYVVILYIYFFLLMCIYMNVVFFVFMLCYFVFVFGIFHNQGFCYVLMWFVWGKYM